MRRALSVRVAVAALALGGGAVLAVLATRGLGQGAVYYYTPGEVAAGKGRNHVIRVGGTVVPGSIRWRRGRGILRFRLSDGRAVLPVANRGAPPDLFRPGREALVEGRLAAGVLRSSQVIVKHEEDYRAPRAGGGGG